MILIRVPGHSGMESNERADDLARRGANSPWNLSKPSPTGFCGGFRMKGTIGLTVDKTGFHNQVLSDLEKRVIADKETSIDVVSAVCNNEKALLHARIFKKLK